MKDIEFNEQKEKDIDKEKDIEKVDKKSEKKKILDLKSKICQGIIFYLCTLVYSVIMTFQTHEINIRLGDFGNITTVLMQIICVYGFKWCCIFSIIGMILTFLNYIFEDVNRVYKGVVVSVLLGSSMIYFMSVGW